jgi:hypothetical protein
MLFEALGTQDVARYSFSSCALASARAWQFFGVISGYVRFNEPIVDVKISATATRATHLRSATKIIGRFFDMRFSKISLKMGICDRLQPTFSYWNIATGRTL